MIVGDSVTVVACQCGVVARTFAGARCGRDRRKNIRATCPTQIAILRCVVLPEEHGGYVQVEDLRPRAASE